MMKKFYFGVGFIIFSVAALRVSFFRKPLRDRVENLIAEEV